MAFGPTRHRAWGLWVQWYQGANGPMGQWGTNGSPGEWFGVLLVSGNSKKHFDVTSFAAVPGDNGTNGSKGTREPRGQWDNGGPMGALGSGLGSSGGSWVVVWGALGALGGWFGQPRELLGGGLGSLGSSLGGLWRHLGPKSRNIIEKVGSWPLPGLPFWRQNATENTKKTLVKHTIP